MIEENALKELIAALGVGLLIGVVRERRHAPDTASAGIRTHTLIALLGATTWGMGQLTFIMTLIIVGSLTVISYLKTVHKDPGLTGEVTVILTFILAAIARESIPLAAGLGVFCAILIQAKSPIHKLSREIISEQELSDGLLLLASALIVMPLVPSNPIDPWGVLRPTTIWKIVVLVMALGMFGHVARRALGARLGLPLAGFFSGFASSTAAIASFGQKAKSDPRSLTVSSASALLANLSSLLLFCGVIATASPELLSSMALPLFAGAGGLLLVALSLLLRYRVENTIINPSSGQTFKLSHALVIACVISAVSLLSAWLNQLIGGAGALLACVLVAIAEIHAAAASLGQLSSTGAINKEVAEWGVIGVLASSAGAKIILSYFSGGKKYCLQVSIGLIAMVMGTLIVMLIFP